MVHWWYGWVVVRGVSRQIEPEALNLPSASRPSLASGAIFTSDLWFYSYFELGKHKTAWEKLLPSRGLELETSRILTMFVTITRSRNPVEFQRNFLCGDTQELLKPVWFLKIKSIYECNSHLWEHIRPDTEHNLSTPDSVNMQNINDHTFLPNDVIALKISTSKNFEATKAVSASNMSSQFD